MYISARHLYLFEVMLRFEASLMPSSTYSCSIGHILEHEICHLGCWAGKGKFLKRRNFCLSKQLFEVVFSCFEGQKKIQIFFKNIFASALKSYIK